MLGAARVPGVGKWVRAGAYIFRHIPTGEFLVGSSTTLRKRTKEYITE